jgi:hypothetical protein
VNVDDVLTMLVSKKAMSSTGLSAFNSPLSRAMHTAVWT